MHPAVCTAQIYIGIKAAAGMSKINYEFGENFASKFAPSFAAGAEFNYQKNNWLLGAECSVSNKGYNFPQSQPVVATLRSVFLPMGVDTAKAQYTSIRRATFYYLQIPVFAAYKISRSIYVEIGPYCGLAIAGTQKTVDVSSRTVSNVDFNSNATVEDLKFRRLDWGARGGLTAELQGRLRVGAYYEYGLANILPDLDSDFSGNKIGARHQAVRLSLSYFFPNIIIRTKSKH